MLSGVLRSDRAIAVNVEIMRAFVELRQQPEGEEAAAVPPDPSPFLVVWPIRRL